jgi:hypothetical protein
MKMHGPGNINLNRQGVPKRGDIKFRRRGITQKKVYNIENMAKVRNKKY